MEQVQNILTQSAAQSAALSAAAAGAKKETPEDIQKRFLTLLVTQMRNQDPLNPLDNAQVTTQLAQLSTVSGIGDLNQTMQGLAASFAAAQTMQSAAMIGRSVLVAGSQADLAGGQAVFGASLAQPVDRLTVSIFDQAGNLVHRADAGPQQAGIVALYWDGATDGGGTAADGRYRISIAAGTGAQSAAAEVLVARQVNGVTTGPGGASLNLAGGGSALLADVKQIFQPAETP